MKMTIPMLAMVLAIAGCTTVNPTCDPLKYNCSANGDNAGGKSPK